MNSLKKRISVLLVFAIIFTQILGCLSFTVAAATESTTLVNGSFEDGLTGWSTSGASATISSAPDKVTDGNCSLMFDKGLTKVWQYIKVDKNSTYTLSFDYLSTSATEGWGWVSFSLASEIKSTPVDTNTISEPMREQTTWTQITGEVETGDNEYVCVYIVMSGSQGASLPARYFDNFKITKEVAEDSSLIINGSFEDDLNGWSASGSSANTSSEKVTNGSYSLKIDKCLTKVWQYIKVEKNKTYRLTFDYLSTSATEGWGWVSFSPASEIKSTPVDTNTISEPMREQTTWTQITGEVETGDNEYVCVYIVTSGSQGVSTPARYFDNFKLEEVVNNDSYIVNSSFEDGLTGWSGNNLATLSTEKSTDGSTSLMFNKGLTKVWQYIPVERNSKYCLSFDYLSTSATEGWGWVSFSPASEIKSTPVDTNTISEPMREQTTWTNIKGVADSGENDYLCIYLVVSGTSGSTQPARYFDNFKIFKVDNSDSVLLNGSFQLDELFWDYDNKYFEISEGIGKDNDNALKVTSSHHKLFSQKLTLNRASNYKLEFDYKGTVPENKIFWGLSDTLSLSSHKVTVAQKINSSTDWSHYSFVFKTEDIDYSTKIPKTTINKYFIIQSCIGSDIIVDNITITPTNEAVTASSDFTRAWVVGPVYENLAEMFLGGPEKGTSLLANSDITTFSDKTVNNATYFYATDNDKDGEECAEIVNGGPDVSHFYDSSIKITAGSNAEIVSIPLKLEPNKKYCFGFMGKSDYYYAKNGEFTRFTYGIADGETGNYLTIQNLSSGHNWKQYQDYFQFLGINDNKWHWNAYSFETNDQTDFYFQFRVTHATVYLDELAIWTPENSTTYETSSPLSQVDDHIVITNENPTLLGIKEGGINLVQNFDFEYAIDSYWSDNSKFVNYMYGKSLNIVDTNSSQGKAFKYKPDVLYPYNIYYFKWIDVEPNTEYTFSAKYQVTKSGNGGFGIVSGYNSADILGSRDSKGNIISENQVYPTIVKEYSFNSQCDWNTVGFTFNSKDHNRVGIFVKDSGGEAYMDDFRLFKTSDAGVIGLNEIANPSFESKGSWNQHWCSIVDSYFTNGKKSLELDCANAYAFQYVPVERNTDYVISYDYICNGVATSGANSWVSLDFCTADNANFKNNKFIDTYTPQDGYGAYSTEWKTMSYTLNSGENDYLCITIRSSVSSWASGVKKYYDNFTLKKASAISEDKIGVLVNGSFEENYNGWTQHWNSPSSAYSSDGNISAEFDCANAYLFQYVPIKKNTDYIVSYDYIDLNGSGYTWVSFDFCKANNEKFLNGTYIDAYTPAETRNQHSAEWTNYSTSVLNSKDNDYLCITIRSTTGTWSGTKKYFDNFKLEEYTPKKNVIINPSFEINGSWNQYWCSIVNSNSSDQNRSLEIDCAKAYAFQFVPVERNTEYTVSYDYISTVSSGNYTRISYDFCKADDVKLLLNKYIDYSSPDNAKGNYSTEWTTVENTLYSGDNDYLCISIRSSDYWPSGAKKYFDNFVLEATDIQASKGTLTGTYKFAFNIPVSFDYYPQSTKEVGMKIWRSDKGEENATDIVLDKEDTVVGVSNISIYGIKNVFCVKPYVVDANGNTHYAEEFTASYLEWLLMYKDNTEPSKAAAVKKINQILDTYYALTGTPAYENQATPVLNDVPQGEWESVIPHSQTGNSDYCLASSKPIQGSFPKGIFRINLDYGVETENLGVLVYKSGAAFSPENISNAAANISFGVNDLTSIDITGIAFANYTKQYTLVPYVASQSGNVYGNTIKVSYSDFLAYALNNADSSNKKKAYAVCELYKSVYGTDICKLK